MVGAESDTGSIFGTPRRRSLLLCLGTAFGLGLLRPSACGRSFCKNQSAAFSGKIRRALRRDTLSDGNPLSTCLHCVPDAENLRPSFPAYQCGVFAVVQCIWVYDNSGYAATFFTALFLYVYQPWLRQATLALSTLMGCMGAMV